MASNLFLDNNNDSANLTNNKNIKTFHFPFKHNHKVISRFQQAVNFLMRLLFLNWMNEIQRRLFKIITVMEHGPNELVGMNTTPRRREDMMIDQEIEDITAVDILVVSNFLFDFFELSQPNLFNITHLHLKNTIYLVISNLHKTSKFFLEQIEKVQY